MGAADSRAHFKWVLIFALKILDYLSFIDSFYLHGIIKLRTLNTTEKRKDSAVIFSVYEEGSKTVEERLSRGIQDEKGKKYPCRYYECHQIEELVEILNRSDVSEIHIKDVIQDFERDWHYKRLGIW